ncbi:MAG: hypothetical protein K8R21_09695 [Leptospira sp.]|nr:hypothetical protein [Leptospira sp.]
MRIKFFLVAYFCLIPLFPERLLYRSKSLIAPRKFVQNEIPAEKKAERIRKQEAASDPCSDLAPDLKGSLSGIPGAGLIFVPENLFRKFNGIFYSKKEFSYSLAVRGNQNLIKKICYSENDSLFRTFKLQRYSVTEKGLRRLKFIAFDSNDRQIAYSEASVYMDFTPPTLNVSINGNTVSNGQKVKCRDGEFLKLEPADSEVELSHAYYRPKNTFSWKYYLDPIKLNSTGKIFYEAMSEDIAGNQSPGFFLECDTDKLQ